MAREGVGFFGALAELGIQSAGASAQRKLGETAYAIYRRTPAGRSAKDWEDMTMKEHNEWYKAAGDIIDKKLG